MTKTYLGGGNNSIYFTSTNKTIQMTDAEVSEICSELEEIITETSKVIDEIDEILSEVEIFLEENTDENIQKNLSAVEKMRDLVNAIMDIGFL